MSRGREKTFYNFIYNRIIHAYSSVLEEEEEEEEEEEDKDEEEEEEDEEEDEDEDEDEASVKGLKRKI